MERGESDKRPVPVVPVILIPIACSDSYNLFFVSVPVIACLLAGLRTEPADLGLGFLFLCLFLFDTTYSYL